jgi:hypothetical protein
VGEVEIEEHLVNPSSMVATFAFEQAYITPVMAEANSFLDQAFLGRLLGTYLVIIIINLPFDNHF